MKRRLGVIGRRGQAGLWAQAADSTPGWRLGSCYHPNTSVWKEFLKGSDAVVIASPTATHPFYLRRLAKEFRGPVLVEKPVAATWKECDRLLRDLRPSFLKRVYVTHNWRVYPWVGKMRELLRNGPILSAEFHLTHDFGFKPGYGDSWRSRKESHPVGPAETQGIHWIDLAHLLFGPVESVSGGVRRVGRVGSAPDTASIFLKMRSGVRCSIHTSYVGPVAYYARVVTTRSILTYRDGLLEIQRQPAPKAGAISRPAPSRTLLRVSLADLRLQPLVRQLRELHLSLEEKTGRRCSLVPVRQGIANVVVLETFARSLRARRPLTLPPFYSKIVEWKRS